MANLKNESHHLYFGALVRVKRGLTRKPWEWEQGTIRVVLR
jgi:hypothetical protein